jgi:hypothetical protein
MNFLFVCLDHKKMNRPFSSAVNKSFAVPIPVEKEKWYIYMTKVLNAVGVSNSRDNKDKIPSNVEAIFIGGDNSVSANQIKSELIRVIKLYPSLKWILIERERKLNPFDGILSLPESIENFPSSRAHRIISVWDTKTLIERKDWLGANEKINHKTCGYKPHVQPATLPPLPTLVEPIATPSFEG